ncbi:MAG: S26 family signal peptidase [Methanomassiliicoccales archaeon]|nr:MAG: S26 family signal peptidase [Methanomassiliicoccales archaeon]
MSSKIWKKEGEKKKSVEEDEVDRELDDEIDKEKVDDEEDEEGEEEGEEEKEEEDKKPFRSALWDVIKDVAIAFIIVLIIIGSIYIYTGNWPPVVVVESDSMQHSDDESFLGVIDTGDLVLVKSIESEDDVVSYMKGKRIGHETYSEYGDVLIYRKNGYTDITPVIHRALIWVEYNETGGSFDIPELQYHDAPEEWYVVSGENRWYDLSGTIVLRNIGYEPRDVSINLRNILNNFPPDTGPHSGFITLGDHNRGNYDQNMLPDGHGGRVRPVTPEWTVGKARGELPWFGLIKLYFQDNSITERAPSNSWNLLIICLVLIFAIPISLDIVLILLERRRAKREGEEEEKEEEGDEEEEEEDEEEGEDEKEAEEKEEPPPPDGELEEEPPPPDDELESEDDLPPPDDWEEEGSLSEKKDEEAKKIKFKRQKKG